MIFGEYPIHDAEGAIFAHSVTAGGITFKKGKTVSRADIEALDAASIQSIYIAILDSDDVAEDEAAARLSKTLAGSHTTCAEAFTGRANIHAAAQGLIRLDTDLINALNAIDEGLTIATLAPYECVASGQMLATVKIIPFAVKRATLERALSLIQHAAISVAPFSLKKADLILTDLPGLKPSLLKKAERVIADRVNAFGINIIGTQVCPHTAQAVKDALSASPTSSEMTLILGASAIVDRADIIPAAIEASGGALIHFGMPVDPGNLLLTASLDERPVLGLPGCARSPKLNGADWIIARLAADLPVEAKDIRAMGVGGLLKEIPSRPQPRNKKKMPNHPRRIAAIILAAGKSTRMGSANKLTTEVGLKPMLGHVTDAALSANIDEIILVTGHEPEKVLSALGGRPMTHVHNPAYEQGLSTSIRTGIEAALASEHPIDAAIILLGDMPFVNASLLNQLIEAHQPDHDRLIAVPIVNGKRGNPVLWDGRFFDELQQLSGDTGAKHLLAEHTDVIAEVEFDDDAALIDIDTIDALETLKPRSTSK